MPLKLNIKKIFCRQKEKQFDQSLKIILHTYMKLTKQNTSQTNSTINPFLDKFVLHSDCNRLRNTATPKTFKFRPDSPVKKNVFQKTTENRSMTDCTQFPSFISEQQLSTRSRICMHFKNFKTSQTLQGQNQIWH